MVELKSRILAALAKLSDRDTHQIAVEDLEKIIRTLPADGVPMLVNSLVHDPSLPSLGPQDTAGSKNSSFLIALWESLRLLAVLGSAMFQRFLHEQQSQLVNNTEATRPTRKATSKSYEYVTDVEMADRGANAHHRSKSLLKASGGIGKKKLKKKLKLKGKKRGKGKGRISKCKI